MQPEYASPAKPRPWDASAPTPHIVTVYDIGEENGQPYLVLPVLPGGDVEGIIEEAEDHKLSIEQAVKDRLRDLHGPAVLTPEGDHPP